jgi:hypothetical protein
MQWGGLIVFEKTGTKGRTSLILKPREVQKHRNRRLLRIKSYSRPTLVKAHKEIVRLGGSLFWEPKALRNQTKPF